MDDATITRLNALNRRFYATVADEFDTTRGAPWPGWSRFLPSVRALAGHAPLRVLDVGCGNGRFGLFLARQLRRRIVYHGIDSSPALLDRARSALESLPDVDVTLTEHDLVESPLAFETAYDLIALFGVLHHIPGAAQRRTLLRGLADSLFARGLLVFSAWRFMDYARFRERIVPWTDDLAVEPGDYLLDWRQGTRALRYCHYVDDAEYAALIQTTDLTLITDYRADGDTGDANLYAVLRSDRALNRSREEIPR